MPKKVKLIHRKRVYEPLSVVSGSSYVMVLGKINKEFEKFSMNNQNKELHERYVFTKMLGENLDFERQHKVLKEPLNKLR